MLRSSRIAEVDITALDVPPDSRAIVDSCSSAVASTLGSSTCSTTVVSISPSDSEFEVTLSSESPQAS